MKEHMLGRKTHWMAETRQRKLGWAGEHTRWPRRDKGSWVGQENTLDGRDETKEAGLGRRRHWMAETRQRKLGWFHFNKTH